MEIRQNPTNGHSRLSNPETTTSPLSFCKETSPRDAQINFPEQDADFLRMSDSDNVVFRPTSSHEIVDLSQPGP